MAYLDHQHTHQRIAGITGVALIHVVLAAGLVTGLAIDGIIADEDERFVAIDLDPPVPQPTNVPPPDPRPDTRDAVTPPIAPDTRIDINQSRDTDVVIDFPPDRPVDRIVNNDLPVGPSRPPEPPVPLFTPRPPVPSNGPAGWVTNNDYPRISIVREQEGDVGYALSITADGRVDECRITVSSGFEALDRATCRLIERRARFRAATDSNGEVIAGTWRGTVSWTIPDN